VSDKTRVLIADDHQAVVEGIRGIIEDYPDFDVVGSASDGCQAVSMAQSLRPDIVILDIVMPCMDGIEAVGQIKGQNSDARILVYTMSALKKNILAFFSIGVSGYVLKEEPIPELIRALKVIRKGGVFYSPTVRDILRECIKELELGQGKNHAKDQACLAKLSGREKEVFVLVADGLKTQEVADRLFISPKTVESHKYNIKEKLKVHSVAEFTKIAAKQGLIDIE
jgi:DNA-binding NarL/FixJ family response regulator